MVLPQFLLNGMQPDGIAMVTADNAATVPFRSYPFVHTCFNLLDGVTAGFDV